MGQVIWAETRPSNLTTLPPRDGRAQIDPKGWSSNRKTLHPRMAGNSSQASSRALRPPFWSSGLPLTSWDLLGPSWTPPGATWTRNDQITKMIKNWGIKVGTSSRKLSSHEFSGHSRGNSGLKGCLLYKLFMVWYPGLSYNFPPRAKNTPQLIKKLV